MDEQEIYAYLKNSNRVTCTHDIYLIFLVRTSKYIFVSKVVSNNVYTTSFGKVTIFHTLLNDVLGFCGPKVYLLFL